MKRITTVLIALALSGTLLFTSGCGEEESTEEQEYQISTIERGDLSLDVSAVGNLALSEKETLTFEMVGTVIDVLVEEGDYVEEGQVLAMLDTTDQEEQVENLEEVVKQKLDAVEQAQSNVEDAEKELLDLDDPEYIEKQTLQTDLAIINAEIALANAQDAYELAENKYNYNYTVPEYIRNYKKAKTQLEIAEFDLKEAQGAMDDILEDIENQRDDLEENLELMQERLEEAREACDEAEDELEEASDYSSEITAPYEGYITKVNITEGQQVQKNASAIMIADPNAFEADVLVGEIDISNIVVGTTATVQVDAMQTVVLPAEVVRISPTATIQSGVVNYSVKVKLLSINMSSGLMQATANPFLGDMDALASGELPEGIQKMVDQGRITQKQAEDMVEMMQSGNFSGTGGFGFRGGMTAPEGEDGETMTAPAFGSGEGDKMPSFGGGQGGFGMMWGDNAINQTTIFSSGADFKLREGLTVTVSILTDTRTNVLLVPSAAISSANGQSVVTIVNSDGTQEQRVITTGLSDWQNTEVTSGLSEGEQVYVPITYDSSGWDMPQNGIVFRSMGGGAMR
ncbi:MAG: HlyD family efflux transporter periplasmic adaptor subunit [Dehalococcoidales bacterium]|nr:HlyD family efflux transporter periplasmic adaptor subunit [Dehalococcoidales bacterium]